LDSVTSLSPISFPSARRAPSLLFCADEVVFAVYAFSVKESWPAPIEGFELVDERMVPTIH